MTVTTVEKDTDTLSMTITAEFDASPDRVWQLWADPRQLERWWGPPSYPATFTDYDLTPGGRAIYHLTGPTGDQPRGWWQIMEVDAPRSLAFRDGFANDDGTPNDSLPVGEARVRIEDIGGGRTRMSIRNAFPSLKAMEQVLAMGMEQGMTEAIGQIDAILAADAPSTTNVTSHTLDVPGAVLTYDVRIAESGTEPVLILIGSPMGAAGFGTLAGHFADRTVVTYDPRGVERSKKADPTSESTPDQHADDLHRIITTLGAAPVDLFASSGGAVNALALVAAHPEDVRTLVAHEPPLAAILPDRVGALGACRAVHRTYEHRGWGAGMAHFIAIVSHKGLFPDDYAQLPPPDPAAFGMPAGDDGSRTDPLFAQNLITCTHYEPDFDALRAASTRIVVAAGMESEGELACRGALAAAERLGTRPAMFPSGHGGFLGGEYGQTGDPDGFAVTLREVLTRAAAEASTPAVGGVPVA